MKCPHCQTEAASASIYCGHCGGKLDGTQPPTKPIATPVRRGPPPLTADDPRTQITQAAAVQQAARGIEAESQVWEGSFSPKAMVGTWIAGGLATIAAVVAAMLLSASVPSIWIIVGLLLLVLWVFLAGRYLVRRLSVHYTLTSQRFMHESGLLWRRTDRVELIDIDDVTFKQGPVERMMNVGSIKITSSDKTDPEIDLPGIDDVKRVAGMIDDLRRKERYRRSLHIESL